MSDPALPLAAMVYEADEGPEMDRILEDLADGLSITGVRLAGAVQHTESQASTPRCDMVLKDLGSGRLRQISVSRDIEVQGCRMEPASIEMLAMLASEAVESGADLFILNRFGKNEAAGRGYRETISHALSAGIPVLVGVSAANLPKWEGFATSGYHRLAVDADAARQWCADALGARAK